MKTALLRLPKGVFLLGSMHFTQGREIAGFRGKKQLDKTTQEKVKKTFNKMTRPAIGGGIFIGETK